jgi:hypothetical protein
VIQTGNANVNRDDDRSAARAVRSVRVPQAAFHSIWFSSTPQTLRLGAYCRYCDSSEASRPVFPNCRGSPRRNAATLPIVTLRNNIAKITSKTLCFKYAIALSTSDGARVHAGVRHRRCNWRRHRPPPSPSKLLPVNDIMSGCHLRPTLQPSLRSGRDLDRSRHLRRWPPPLATSWTHVERNLIRDHRGDVDEVPRGGLYVAMQ